MDGSVYGQYKDSGDSGTEESSQSCNHESQLSAETEAEAGESNPSEPVIDTDELSSEMEHFSRLSSELTELLSNLSGKITSSAEKLNEIQSAVDLKEAELKRLHNIEAGAVALEQLLEDHRLQKEGFERVMEHQHRLWDEEKASREQENKEYLENLQLQREQEDREYLENKKIQREKAEREFQQTWAAEKSKAREQLEEELRGIEQSFREKQEAIEKNCLERELILKEKELEWVQLIQELEQFMSKLTQRIQSKAGFAADPQNMQSSAENPVSDAESSPDSSQEPETAQGTDSVSGVYPESV